MYIRLKTEKQCSIVCHHYDNEKNETDDHDDNHDNENDNDDDDKN